MPHTFAFNDGYNFRYKLHVQALSGEILPFAMAQTDISIELRQNQMNLYMTKFILVVFFSQLSQNVYIGSGASEVYRQRPPKYTILSEYTHGKRW